MVIEGATAGCAVRCGGLYGSTVSDVITSLLLSLTSFLVSLLSSITCYSLFPRSIKTTGTSTFICLSSIYSLTNLKLSLSNYPRRNIHTMGLFGSSDPIKQEEKLLNKGTSRFTQPFLPFLPPSYHTDLTHRGKIRGEAPQANSQGCRERRLQRGEGSQEGAPCSERTSSLQPFLPHGDEAASDLVGPRESRQRHGQGPARAREGPTR